MARRAAAPTVYRPVRAAARWSRAHPYVASGVGAAVVLLAARAVAGVLSGRPARASTRGRVNPPGPEYAREHRPRRFAGACEFVAFYLPLAMRRYGLSRRQAALLVALFARETGFGRSLWNNNVGNIRAFATTEAPWHRLANGVPFRTYFSPEEGADAVVRLLSNPAGRYAAAWNMLLNGDAGWYQRAGRAGYFEEGGPGGPTFEQHQAEYLSVVRAVERCA